MSDTATPETPAAAPEQPAPATPKRKPSWKRRIIYLFAGIVVALLLFRVLLYILLPTVINRTARQFGFDLDYRRLELTLLGGDFAIWDVTLAPRDGRRELVRTDYAFVNASVWELFKLNLTVYRLEADGVTLDVRRTADGRIPLLEQLQAGFQARAAEQAEDDAATQPSSPAPPLPQSGGADAKVTAEVQPAKVSFDPIAFVEAIRLNRVTVRLHDDTLSPPFEQTIFLNLRVSDVGHPTKPLTGDLELYTSNMLDILRLEGTGDARGSEAEYSLAFDLRGLRAYRAQQYLSLLGLAADGREMSLHGEAKLFLRASDEKPGSVFGTGELSNIFLRSGLDPLARLDVASVEIAELSPSSLLLKTVNVQGGRLNAGRLEDGRLQFGAISTGAAPPTTAPFAPTVAGVLPPDASEVDLQDAARGVEGDTPAVRVTVEVGTPPPGQRFRWGIEQLTATDLFASFDDRGVQPPTVIEGGLETLTIRDLRSDGSPGDKVLVSLEASAPGIFEAASIEGHATPFDEPAGAAAQLRMDGIRPTAAQPYLALIGLRSNLDAGALQADLSATVRETTQRPTLDLAVTDVQLRDEGRSLLSMPQVKVDQFRYDSTTGGISAKAIDLTGPTLTLRRLPQNHLQMPGLTYTGFDAASGDPASAGRGDDDLAAATSPATTASTRPATGPLRPIQFDRVTWNAGTIRFEDLTAENLQPIEITEAMLELRNFNFDPRPGAPAGTPGTITGRLRSPGFLEAIDLQGTLNPSPGSVTAAFTVGGRGLDLRPMTHYLAPFGIQPVLEQGTLDATVEARLTQRDEVFEIGARADGVKLAGRDREWLSVREASLDRLAIAPDRKEIGTVTLRDPVLHVARDAESRWQLLGLRLVPAVVAANPPPVVEPVVEAAQDLGDAAGATTQPDTAASEPDLFDLVQSLGVIEFAGLDASNARIVLSDRAGRVPVDLGLAINASLSRVGINTPALEPATFQVLIADDAGTGKLEAAGTIQQSPTAFDLTAKVNGEGISYRPLKAYLPATIRPDLTDGRVEVQSFLASVRRGEQGGLAASMEVGRTALTQADRPLVALDSFAIAVPRIDPAGGEIALDRIALAGLEADVRRLPDGSLDVLGLALNAPPEPLAPADGNAPGADRPDDQLTPAGEQADVKPAGDAPPPPSEVATPAADARQIVAEAQEALPLFSLQTLDLAIKQLRFTDEARPQSAPVALADVRLVNDGPIRLLGPTPDQNPPLKLDLTGRVDPVLGQFSVITVARPFTTTPDATVTIEASGIDGAAINRVVPELMPKINTSTLRDGRFQSEISTTARVRRRGPTQIDWGRGFELDLAIANTAFRDGADGAVLAGVETIRGENIKVDPPTGNVTIRQVEINALQARTWRDQAGLNVLGIAIQPTAAATQPSEPAPADAPPPEAPQPAALQPDPAQAAGPTPPEIKLDRLMISGLDFTFEDRLVDPPLVAPITGLDADVRGLSSRLMEAERPVRFDVALTSGKVELPKPLRGGIITGALDDAARRAAGERIEQETEMREFFAQIVAQGNLQFHPQPKGRAIAAVSGLELAAIRGIAAESGVSISGGVFDGRVQLRSRDDGALDTKARLVVTDLRIQDSPDQAVVRWLALPAPLDAVIAAVEAPDGSITLPVEFSIEQGQVNTGELVSSAIGAVGQVLAVAVVSAPVKIVTGLAGLITDTKGEYEWQEQPPLSLPLESGVVTLPSQTVQPLVALLAEARGSEDVRIAVEHRLGSADVQIADTRANPPDDRAMDLAESLRQRRAELLAMRDQLIGPARAQVYGLDLPQQEQAVQQLRAVQQELADVEDAFDRLYDLQRRGADLQAPRRTRSAAIDLADARLQQVRALVRDVAGPVAAERVRVGVARFQPAETEQSTLEVQVARRVKRR
jgi:hypothetical protein